MLYRLPKFLPAAPVLLADLGHPKISAIASALDVSERTVWRWHQAIEWPRAPHLALYFASTWGWSGIECDARYRVATAEGLAQAQARELAQLRAEVQRLAALACYGSANAPSLRA